MFVFIAHAEADQAAADDLKAFLKSRGLVTETETGAKGFRHLQASDVVVALWSQKSVFGTHRMMMERRMLDAWADGRLVLVKLDHGFLPVGLRDLPAIDASFETGRQLSVWPQVERAAREAMTRALVGGEPQSGLGRLNSTYGDMRKAMGPAPAEPIKKARARRGPISLWLIFVVLLAGGAYWAYFLLSDPARVDRNLLQSTTAELAQAQNEITRLREAEARLATQSGVDQKLADIRGDIAVEQGRIAQLGVEVAEIENRIRARSSYSGPDENEIQRKNQLLIAVSSIAVALLLLSASMAIGLVKGSYRRARRRASKAAVPAAAALAPASAAALFISYAHADDAAVTPVVDAVKANGREVWIDKTGIQTGDGWAGEIVRAIKAARGIMVMCSKHAFESDHVKRELYLADRYKKPMKPVFLEAAQPPEDFEYFFAGVQWLELYKLPEADRPAAIGKALAAV